MRTVKPIFTLDADFPGWQGADMKLRDYLTSTDLTLSDFARVLGRPVQRVHEWASGRKIPSGTNLAAIERATGGRVTAVDFVGEKK